MYLVKHQHRFSVLRVRFAKHDAATPHAEFKKRATFVILAAVLAVAVLVITWQARTILLTLFAGFLGALILATFTSMVQRWLRLPRAMAFLVLLIVLSGAVALAGWLRGPELLQQFGQLQVDLPAAARRIYASLEQSRWGHWLIDIIRQSGDWSGWLTYAASGIGGAMSVILSTAACAVLVTITSIYLSAEPAFYRQVIHELLPVSARELFDACLQSAIRALRFWLLSRLVSMTAIGLIVAAGLWSLGVPLAGTLAIIAALLTFVPNIGPFASALPAALMAFAISPTKGLLCLALFCIAHFIEGNFVTPIADRHIVKLPPFLTLSFQLILAPLTGALGVALATPLLAVILGIMRALPPATIKSNPNFTTTQTSSQTMSRRVEGTVQTEPG